MFFLILLTIIYIIALVLLYPLTVMLRMEEGKPRVFWMPRVFFGYAAPVAIKGTKKQSKKGWAKIKKNIRIVRKFLDLVRLSTVERVWFDFLFSNRGPSHLEAECIISFTVSDIIVKHTRRIRRRWRRKNYDRRTRDCFFDEYSDEKS